MALARISLKILKVGKVGKSGKFRKSENLGFSRISRNRHCQFAITLGLVPVFFICMAEEKKQEIPYWVSNLSANKKKLDEALARQKTAHQNLERTKMEVARAQKEFKRWGKWQN